MFAAGKDRTPNVSKYYLEWHFYIPDTQCGEPTVPFITLKANNAYLLTK